MANNTKAYDIKDQLYTPFRVTLEFTLATAVKKYVLGSAQQLNKPSVRINKITAFWDEALTESVSGGLIASLKTYMTAYLTLQDPGSNNIIQQESLGRYLPDTKIKEILVFNYQQIDMTKSFFEFPSTVQTTADNGKVVQLIIEYIDVNIPLMQCIYPMQEGMN